MAGLQRAKQQDFPALFSCMRADWRRSIAFASSGRVPQTAQLAGLATGTRTPHKSTVLELIAGSQRLIQLRMDEGAEALVQGLEGSSISVGDPLCPVSRIAIGVCELRCVLHIFLYWYVLRSQTCLPRWKRSYCQDSWRHREGVRRAATCCNY